MTIDLPAEAEAKLTAEAKRRGVSVDRLIVEFAESLAHGSASTLPAFVAAGASDDGTSHQINELLADGFGQD
jgi:hypothetical protein